MLADEVLERMSALSDPALKVAAELPENQRQALEQRVVAGRVYADIARELRCSEAVVRKPVGRALSTVRERTQEGWR